MVKKPAYAIVTAIDAAAARWGDSDFLPRREARDAIAARTGYSQPTIEYALDRLFQPLTRDAIAAIVQDELGSLEALDTFVARRGRPKAHALPVGRVCVIASRTTIGVAVIPAIFAIVAKCDVLVKDREDHLAAAFFETLVGEMPELRDAAVARPWQGDRDSVDLDAFDTVVAFGSNATLQRIGSALKSHTRFIGFGSKASAGYITRQALCNDDAARALARAAAHDVVLYESEGCLSLHVLFVEDGAAVCVDDFATMLSDAIVAAGAQLPPAREVTIAARRALARDLAVFRGEREAVRVNPPIEDPPLFQPRAIAIRAIKRSEDAARYLKMHGIELEALALAGYGDGPLELAAQMNVSRVAPFGTLQSPPLGGFHGGRPRIAEFVRWISDER